MKRIKRIGRTIRRMVKKRTRMIKGKKKIGEKILRVKVMKKRKIEKRMKIKMMKRRKRRMMRYEWL